MRARGAFLFVVLASLVVLGTAPASLGSNAANESLIIFKVTMDDGEHAATVVPVGPMVCEDVYRATFTYEAHLRVLCWAEDPVDLTCDSIAVSASGTGSGNIRAEASCQAAWGIIRATCTIQAFTCSHGYRSPSDFVTATCVARVPLAAADVVVECSWGYQQI